MTQEEMTDIIYELIDVELEEGMIAKICCENNTIYFTTSNSEHFSIVVEKK